MWNRFAETKEWQRGDMLNISGTRVPKALVKQLRSDRAGERGCRRRAEHHGVQITNGITTQDHRPGLEVLDRKTRDVKFDRNKVHCKVGVLNEAF